MRQEVESESHSNPNTCRKVKDINSASYLVTWNLEESYTPENLKGK